MANPTCTTASLITNAVCYRRGVINPLQQKALLVYAKALELAAIGGTDYTAVLASTLLSDSACPPAIPDYVTAARINIAFLNAATAGASVPATMTLKLAAVKCLVHAPGGMDDLERADLILTCKLGVHKAYTQ